jgi:hypothetical protein
MPVGGRVIWNHRRIVKVVDMTVMAVMPMIPMVAVMAIMGMMVVVVRHVIVMIAKAPATECCCRNSGGQHKHRQASLPWGHFEVSSLKPSKPGVHESSQHLPAGRLAKLLGNVAGI